MLACVRLASLAELDISALESDARTAAEKRVSDLRARAILAVAEENAAELQRILQAAEDLQPSLANTIQHAQANRAVNTWAETLRELGYSVDLHCEEQSGITVIKASSFPMRSLEATFKPGSAEVGLKVNGEHDTTQCVRDIDSIQKALAQRGIEFEMTDWGRANPGTHSLQTQSLQQTTRRG